MEHLASRAKKHDQHHNSDHDLDLVLNDEGTPAFRPTESPGHESRTPSGTVWLIGAASVGAAIALSLGAYGRFHTPTGLTIDPIQPRNMLSIKSTFATIAFGLAAFQLLSAMTLYGKGPFTKLTGGSAPAWLGPAHRWSGTAAFVATLPAAYHCLWSLGFQTTTTRVLIHSVAGCAFYGAFATKLLVLRSNRMPGWALPLVGATLVTILTVVWFASALFFFTGSL